MLWRRIRQQLSEYLSDKEADGKAVVNWYHRQFWEAAKFHAANEGFRAKSTLCYDLFQFT